MTQIAFVGIDQTRIEIAADILCAASPVWRSRLKETNASDIYRPVEEPMCTSQDLKAFKKLVTFGTQDMNLSDDILLVDLQHSLRLVHKYDCVGIKCLIDYIFEPRFFPDTEMSKIHRNYYAAPSWMTQTHIDYLVHKSEVYDESAEFCTMARKFLTIALGCTRLIYMSDTPSMHHKEWQTNELDEFPYVQVCFQDDCVIDEQNRGTVLCASKLGRAMLLEVLALTRSTMYTHNFLVTECHNCSIRRFLRHTYQCTSPL